MTAGVSSWAVGDDEDLEVRCMPFDALDAAARKRAAL